LQAGMGVLQGIQTDILSPLEQVTKKVIYTIQTQLYVCHFQCSDEGFYSKILTASVK
jgi:hypothetical protein